MNVRDNGRSRFSGDFERAVGNGSSRNNLAATFAAPVLVAAACWIGGGVGAASAQDTAAPSVLAGVYTEQQALQGQALYYEHCLLCHGETMAGVDKAPALAGPQFGSTWNDAPLAALVARILTMPPEKPGSLAREQSVDILAYMLWYNGLPPGTEALGSTPDVLGAIRFEIPPAN